MPRHHPALAAAILAALLLALGLVAPPATAVSTAANFAAIDAHARATMEAWRGPCRTSPSPSPYSAWVPS